jgi:plasmid stabilization system protein ParE
MRTVRYSKTFNDQLNTQLAYGYQRFGRRTVEKVAETVYGTIDDFLAHYPRAKPPHPRLRLHVYPIARTPFVVVYDFDDQELRCHFILHRSASLDDLDPASAEW